MELPRWVVETVGRLTLELEMERQETAELRRQLAERDAEPTPAEPCN